MGLWVRYRLLQYCHLNLNDFVEKLSADCELKDDVEVRVSLDDIFHANYRRMVNSPWEVKWNSG